jgi:thiol:disulfide interchange protein DsbD
VLAFLLAYSAKQSDTTLSIVLLFVYSFGFALPYVFLGGLAAKASTIKVSPRVQVSTKAIFASVMIALGLYYLRIPAYGLIKNMSQDWPIISQATLSFGGFAMLLSLAVPAIYENKKLLLIPSFALGLGLFSTSQWITTSQTIAAGKGLHWIKSEKKGLALAKQLKAPVLVDAWAEWCEACKKMDGSTFTDPLVIKTINGAGFVLIKLDLTESTDENELLMEKYEIHSLPTLTLLRPGGEMKDKQSILGFVSSAVLINRIKMFLED